MKKQDLVSIVTPVFNAEKFIEAMIASVQEQSYTNWELILIDDASQDSSVDIIQQHAAKDQRIHLYEMDKNVGAALSRNRGIAEAKGKFLAFLDADDLWTKDKLAKQVAFMKEKGCSFSYAGYEFADEYGKPNGKKVLVPKKISYQQALKRSAIWTTTVMINLEKIGKHEIKMPQYSLGEDTATWWYLLRNYGDAYGLAEVMAYYRRHNSGTLSSNKLKAIAWRWHLYRKHEKLSLATSVYYFFHYAIYAVSRRV